jgi:very-short-patch-repair endonuclease
MRREPTPAEALLREHLRDRQVAGAKFRRQHTIGRYVADFCCPAALLVVEADGAVHDDPRAQETDEERRKNLEAMGFRILRFRNEEILHAPDKVIARITNALRGNIP